MGQKLYLECYSGISGDMTVAALSGLMKDRTPLFCVLDHMPVEGFSYELKQVKKSGIDAWDFLVKLDAEHENHDHDMEYLHGHSHTHDHDHHHGHEGHHHADEVFTSWGKETAHKYTEEELDYLLKALSETDAYGTVLRSKGIIQMADGSWKQFDMVPEEYEVREGQADYTGRVCVIGTDLKEEDLIKLFHI